MCAFQMGLYALGLHNSVSPNWLSRTYSSHVSWITGQAMELGASALSFLIRTWEGHLTPPEAASVADKASKTRDAAMVSNNDYQAKIMQSVVGIVVVYAGLEALTKKLR